jgi:predicted nuclease with RNAse H fold
MWSSRCGRSNVWIAETESGVSGLRLVNLQRVQQLSGDCDPFTRLVQYLRQSSFDVAAIDAPFSIPEDHLQAKGHQELLELVANMELSGGRPFPSAQAFVNNVLGGMTPVVKKPLRRTEQHWRQKGVNVRSTLWSGPRGGAAMTAACLKLLHQADCPIWPWERSGPRLLVETFPAAQLCQWGLPHQAYNRSTEKESVIRRSLVLSLATRIELGVFRGMTEECADAVDAVVCAFAANAVATGHALWYAEEFVSAEGLIAVASR